MNLLVTGGCGFIGSCFIRYTLKHHPDWQITNIDKLTYAGNPRNLGDYRAYRNYSFLKADICDIDQFDDQLGQSVDWIVNFSAESHVDRSIDDSYPFLKTNILGTHALLEFARKHGNISFLQVSTDEIYGEILYGSNNENFPLRPGSPYSVSKASADLLVLAYHRTYKLPYIITRSTNNYGPYQYPEKLIPLFLLRLLKGKTVGLYGDGQQIRDWIWVEDHVRAIDLLLQKEKLNEIYNVGSGKELTNLEITNIIIKLLNLDTSLITFAEDRKGHDRRYSLDTLKLRRLGWKPKVSFKDGLKQTIEWYKEHQNWWKK